MCVDLAAAHANTDYLSADERARARRFRRERDAVRWTTSRAALRLVLGGCIGVSPASLRFALGPNGKPSHEGVYFNLSHSGELALIGLTTLTEIGVDLEHCRALPDRDAVARQFFSEAEQSAFFALPDELRTAAFYRCWTRKEAVIKATGEGLSADLAAFDVTVTEDAPAQVVRADSDDWRLFSGAPRPGYQYAVAIRAPVEPELRVFSYTDYCRECAIG